MNKLFKNNIALDLGTSKLRIYKDSDLVVNVPMQINTDKETVDNLISEGRIGNFNGTYNLILKEIKSLFKPKLKFFYPSFTSIVSVPSNINDVALRAYRDMCDNIGSRNSNLICDVHIAALGLGIEDDKSKCSTIIDFGAGKVSVTTIRGYNIIKNSTNYIAGKELDEQIKGYISREYNLVIDKAEAERLKIESADFRANNLTNNDVRINGKDKTNNKDKDITIKSSEITDCIRNDVFLIKDRILRHFDNIDEMDLECTKKSGIYIIGRGAKLKGFVQMISDEINLADESYNQEVDYINEGMKIVQANPDKVYSYMMK
jgi:rod shape-determining protein MreB